jgi:hypothetical protein
MIRQGRIRWWKRLTVGARELDASGRMTVGNQPTANVYRVMAVVLVSMTLLEAAKRGDARGLANLTDIGWTDAQS